MEVLSTVIDRLSYYIHNNGNIHDFIALTLNDCDLGKSLFLSLPVSSFVKGWV